jgi:hypothetical protein
MTNPPDRPEMIDDDSAFQQQVLDRLDRLSADVERSNEKFSNYQQATQWVVQLAFTLIASATITVIITAVLKR